MAKEIEITGIELRKALQGEHSFSLNGGISANKHRFANSSYLSKVEDQGTIPWMIPSPFYYGISILYSQNLLWMLNEGRREIPTYIITTWTNLGGENIYDHKRKIVGKSIITYPCQVIFRGCIFKKYTDVESIFSKYSILFEECTFESTLNIHDCEFDSIVFKKCNINNLLMKKNFADKIEFVDCAIKQGNIY